MQYFQNSTFARKFVAPATAFAAVVACLMYADQAFAGSNSVSNADRAFVAKVSQGGMFEVVAGGLAAKRGATQAIRDLGVTEQHDHMLVGDKLVHIVTPLGISHSPHLNAMFSQKVAALQELSGVEFDRAFITAMDDIHNKDGAAFAQEAQLGKNSRLRAFARETYQIVQVHLGALHASQP